jgi:large subunit ribosomal protein L34e
MPEKKRSSKHKCARCGCEMHGMPRHLQGKMSKLSKTERRPQRIFGGYYCANCTREVLKERARKI